MRFAESVSTWFPDSIDPVHVGWYSVDFRPDKLLWDGRTWREQDANGALVPTLTPAVFRWRGLAAPTGLTRIGWVVRGEDGTEDNTVVVDCRRVPHGVRPIYVESA